MDIGALVCSTLRCESQHPFDAVDDTLHVPPGIEESSGSESSYGQGKSSFPSYTRLLQSGHTSPSSLALTRRPREAPLYLKHQQSISDSTAPLTDTSSISYSSRRANSNMSIGRSVAPFQKKEQAPEDAVPVEFQQFRSTPSPLRSKAWAEPSAEEYDVRSKNYMKTGVKKPSQKSAFELLTVDLINSETPIYNGLCSHPGERVQLALERERETGVKELPEFVFAVNLCIPGEVIYHAVFYYGIDKATMDEIQSGETAFGRLMNKFIFGDSDEFRNNAFKLIPRVVEGNFLVRKGVGTKPAILGKKIKQCYVKTDRYFEIIVDIASDGVASRITKLCLGYCRTLVVDMMFALEGKDESTLPERIFGGATLQNIDFDKLDGKRCVR